MQMDRPIFLRGASGSRGDVKIFAPMEKLSIFPHFARALYASNVRGLVTPMFRPTQKKIATRVSHPAEQSAPSDKMNVFPQTIERNENLKVYKRPSSPVQSAHKPSLDLEYDSFPPSKARLPDAYMANGRPPNYEQFPKRPDHANSFNFGGPPKSVEHGNNFRKSVPKPGDTQTLTHPPATATSQN